MYLKIFVKSVPLKRIVICIFFEEYLNESHVKVQICNMPHFKAFGMMNLQYEIRICHKIHNKGAMSQ